MSPPSSPPSTLPAVLMLLGTILVALGAVATSLGGAYAQSSSPFDAAEITPTPVARASDRLGIDFGPIREVGPRIREALDDDDLSDFMHLVDDPDGVLAEEQASELADDAHRLTTHGVPALFIIRESSRTREESVLDGDALRRDRSIETAPGADDGILFLVTQPTDAGGVRGSRQTIFLTISVGAQTLPKGGLNAASLQNVHDKFIRPRLRFGLVSDALRVGIRKVIYLETYYPDPSPPLSSLQGNVRSTLSVVAPIVSVVSLGSVLAAWRGGASPSRLRRHASWKRYILALALAGIAVLLLATVSVYGESRPGIIAVIVAFVAISAHIRLLRRGAELPHRSLRLDRAPATRSPARTRMPGRRQIAPGSTRGSSPATTDR
ncbi:MAG: hypothetical protein H0W23_00470 [Chloroflexia bacterium]|nr:hypothetical protein [Chloroflexia bacterium]